MYAFWKYDSYPGYLGGKVGVLSIDHNGVEYATIPSFGAFRFKIDFKIENDDEGLAFLDALDELRRYRKADIDAVESKHTKLRDALIAKAKNPPTEQLLSKMIDSTALSDIGGWADQKYIAVGDVLTTKKGKQYMCVASPIGSTAATDCARCDLENKSACASVECSAKLRRDEREVSVHRIRP